jgi:hypothetical protein
MLAGIRSPGSGIRECRQEAISKYEGPPDLLSDGPFLLFGEARERVGQSLGGLGLDDVLFGRGAGAFVGFSVYSVR